jgi:spore germination cell wall hydrolase CwlJ-like protein
MRYLIILLALIPTLMHTETVPLQQPIKKQILVNTKEEKCLAVMIYGEARGEPIKGKIAVAYTALNRAVKKTVCKVVLARRQYSIFDNNPSLRAAALSSDLEPHKKDNLVDIKSWEESIKVAQLVMRKVVEDPTMGSTNYLAPKLMKTRGYRCPKWSKVYKLMVTIEHHKFYKLVDKKVAKL